MRAEKFVREMSLIPALSGHEQKMAAYMSELFAGLGYHTTQDTLGNVIAKVPGTDPGAHTIMIFAHMDQVGFVVRKITDDGFILLERVSGIPEKVLPGLKVIIEGESGELITGIIGVKSHHATLQEEKYKVDTYMNLYVDAGFQSKEDALQHGVDIGCAIVYQPSYEKMLGHRVVATSLDNRCATAALAEIGCMLRDHPPICDTYLVGTVQEEFNLRGGMMAARTVKPDVAICIDLALDTNTPDLAGKGDVRMGDGPAIIMYNFHGRGTLNGSFAHPAMIRLFKESAKVLGLPLQREAAIGGLTDLAYVQLEGTGVVCADIGIPARYFHSPVESCDLRDVESTAQLIHKAVCSIGADTDFSR